MMASWKAFVSLGMSFLYNARYFKAEGRLKGNPGDDGYVGLVVPMNLHTNVNLTGFTSKLHPSECRLEASHVIRLLCHTSVLTLQMFIALVLSIWSQYDR